MKELVVNRLDHAKVSYIIALFALVFSYVGANSKCCYIFHQPEKPDLSKLRKY
ncbi:MAG: cyclic lactone autoinducer peptide [Lachnospiraceae bacterium]|nr:cyclic lactone autoinducer peptide [Lachnospiraceae bacterium]